MFDTVYVVCPKCGEESDIQSKAGPCMLERYTVADAPASVLGDLDGETLDCNCGLAIAVQTLVTFVPYDEDDDDDEEW
jgi:hypothetical protein